MSRERKNGGGIVLRIIKGLFLPGLLVASVLNGAVLTADSVTVARPGSLDVETSFNAAPSIYQTHGGGGYAIGAAKGEIDTIIKRTSHDSDRDLKLWNVAMRDYYDGKTSRIEIPKDYRLPETWPDRRALLEARSDLEIASDNYNRRIESLLYDADKDTSLL